MLSLVMEVLAGEEAVVTPARLTDLTGALIQEQRLIDERRQALLRQRAGMASGNPELIDESVYAIARTLLTLEEAQRRRRPSLTAAVLGRPGVALSNLESSASCPRPCSPPAKHSGAPPRPPRTKW